MKDSNNTVNSKYVLFPLVFSVQKNHETKEISITSTVFRVSAYVSINNFIVQNFTGSDMHNMKTWNCNLHNENIILHFQGLFSHSCCHCLFINSFLTSSCLHS